jgi:adenosylcobinamide-GDP ribazoletransferase
MSGNLTARREELVGAFMLLTRLPVAALSRGAVPPAACVWAFPVVGLVIGGIGGAIFWAAAALGLPPVIAAIASVAATILATGGLHEDGLADTADGLGGGGTRTRKLEIMRDSRIGSFGAVALMVVLATRIAALATLGHPAAVAMASIVAAMLGRGAMICLLAVLRPARADGLAAPLAATPMPRSLFGLAIAATAMLLPGGPAALVAACLAALAMGGVARRQIGGYTGDILGATEQLAECAALAAMLSRFA